MPPNRSHKQYHYSLRVLPLTALIFAVMSMLIACHKDDPIERAKIKAKQMPTMTTRNVMTIISDSGKPQYRLVTPLWIVYDNCDTPLWILPGGPYLEKFDEKMKTVFTVACDSAVNNRLENKWILTGDVEFKENPGLLILTQYLVWDQARQMVYSDSFIHIEQPDKIIEGYGFEGHTNNHGKLTSYILHRPTASLPYDQSKLDAAAAAGVDPSSIDPSQLPAGVTP